MSSYFPPAGAWALAQPDDERIDAVKLAQALTFATEAETRWPTCLDAAMKADPSNNEPPPWNEVLGPTLDRGGPSGLVLRHGRMVGAYGDPTRVEMTFSVAKSYLAILTGVALRLGLIRSLDDRVGEYVDDGGFDSPQNRDITWRHFLYQSSEWEGTLFEKPDLIDRHRRVGPGADNSRKGTHRDLQAPGSFYEYNDVRVNRLSLSLMRVFKQPLGEVLKQHIMDPIGASDSWVWHPYRNSTVDVDGKPMASVPGGSHWGGGIFVNSEDHARIGLLMLNDGVWDGVRLLPEGFVDAVRAPSPCFDGYGMLWWLNTGQRANPNLPATSYMAKGAGSHVIWIEPAWQLVVVLRWVNAAQANDVMSRIAEAIHTQPDEATPLQAETTHA